LILAPRLASAFSIAEIYERRILSLRLVQRALKEKSQH
jgi:hypothetical protein